ncbi:hypothetical protein ACFX5K_06160 [Rickettsiales bacterium LUAb2]
MFKTPREKIKLCSFYKFLRNEKLIINNNNVLEIHLLSVSNKLSSATKNLHNNEIIKCLIAMECIKISEYTYQIHKSLAELDLLYEYKNANRSTISNR